MHAEMRQDLDVHAAFRYTDTEDSVTAIGAGTICSPPSPHPTSSFLVSLNDTSLVLREEVSVFLQRRYLSFGSGGQRLEDGAFVWFPWGAAERNRLPAGRHLVQDVWHPRLTGWRQALNLNNIKGNMRNEKKREKVEVVWQKKKKTYKTFFFYPIWKKLQFKFCKMDLSKYHSLKIGIRKRCFPTLKGFERPILATGRKKQSLKKLTKHKDTIFKYILINNTELQFNKKQQQEPDAAPDHLTVLTGCQWRLHWWYGIFGEGIRTCGTTHTDTQDTFAAASHHCETFILSWRRH